MLKVLQCVISCSGSKTEMIRDKDKDKEKVLQVRMSEEVIEKAKERAKSSGLNLSLVVRKLLEDYINNPQPNLIF